MLLSRHLTKDLYLVLRSQGCVGGKWELKKEKVLARSNGRGKEV